MKTRRIADVFYMVAAALGAAALSGCTSYTKLEREVLNSTWCICSGSGVYYGSKYAALSDCMSVQMVVVEWRWLEDADTHERFFALANDWDESVSRHRDATRFKSYGELEQAVTNVFRNDCRRDFCDQKIAKYYCWEPCEGPVVQMKEKMGFPETSPYPWDQYYALGLARIWNRNKLRHGERVDAVQGLIQYKYFNPEESGCGQFPVFENESEWRDNQIDCSVFYSLDWFQHLDGIKTNDAGRVELQ